MIISHKHRFIFLKTRKTGGTSIELALRSMCGDDDVVTPVHEDRFGGAIGAPRNFLYPRKKWPIRDGIEYAVNPRMILRGRARIGYSEHMHAKAIREKVGEPVWSSYFKFSVERNPWDRQVSLYYWRRNRHRWRNWKPPTFREFTLADSVLDNWRIYSIDNQIVADHVIRYSPDLSAGLAEALAKIGMMAPSLGRAKGSSRSGSADGYRRLYDDETREIVRQRYQREIEYFGWTF